MYNYLLTLYTRTEDGSSTREHNQDPKMIGVIFTMPLFTGVPNYLLMPRDSCDHMVVCSCCLYDNPHEQQWQNARPIEHAANHGARFGLTSPFSKFPCPFLIFLESGLADTWPDGREA